MQDISSLLRRKDISMKIVYIGAGSYVFGPSVLAQTFLEQSLPDVHLALVDPDLETIEGVAAVGRRMARERGLRATVTTHAQRPEALEDADFVICSASPQMQRRFGMDKAIIAQYLPGHLITEFGGIAGISYSLRQIALTEAITDDMNRHCPNAWLLNVSNPLPRVVQAAQENGIQTAGFCSVSLSAYAMLWEIFRGEYLGYPYTEARELWQVTTAGLNHFAWVTEFHERATGRDLLPALRERMQAGQVGQGNPHAVQMARETGYLLVPSDEHTQDFLPPLGPVPESVENPWHGDPNQRRHRIELLHEIGEGTRPWDELLVNEAWEKPLAFVSALTGGEPAFFPSLDLSNHDGQIPNLPRQVFVETPCQVSAEGVKPQTVTLPPSVLPLCERTAQVTDTIVRAARTRNRALVHEAVLLDPTILDKTAGIQAIDACLNAHADMLPAYS
jgi:alpha-galactosidase